MYVYPHLIPRNIAPPGAKRIVICNAAGTQEFGLPLGSLAPVEAQPLYRVAAAFDAHLWPHAAVEWTPESKLDTALTRAEAEGCAFFILGGDGTQTGLYREGIGGYEIDEGQLAKFAEIRDSHTIPVHFMAGNHEHYYGKSLTENLELWSQYTGRSELSFALEQGEDLFLLVGQPRDTAPMSDEDLHWLYDTLEANRNRRCFVFVHSFLPGGAGNPLGFRNNGIFGYWGTLKTGVFNRLMAHYGCIVVNGHSHSVFSAQELDARANYSDANGYDDLHAPALGPPRQIFADGTYEESAAESYFYIMDVHETCVVFRGIDNVTGEPVPIGTFCIPTPTKSIEAGTFADPTGTIVT